MKRVMCVAALSLLAAACASKGPRTPTVGDRISVLSSEQGAEIDPSLSSTVVSVPPPVSNADWAQPGGNPAHAMIHVALAPTPAKQWSISIGQGSGPRARLASEPVVAGGKIFTVDTRATVRAFNAATGGQLWEAQARGEGAAPEALFGGGVSVDEGRVYVTNGAGFAFALNADTGAQLWVNRLGSPLRGAPTVAEGNVYVVSQDNQVFALDADTGATQWTGSGAAELAGVFGSAAPAFSQLTVVTGFSSGELNAYRFENGQVVWQDALTRTGVSTTVGNLSDIDADPVIDNGRVFAVGQGGRMVAVELITGQRAWELNIAGISTPWVAGDWVFVVTDKGQLLCVSRGSGKIRWMTQLQRYRSADRPRSGPVFWRGPVLAGGNLILANSLGQIAFVDPVSGSVRQTVAQQVPISLPPVVAGGMMYVLDDSGMLTAYK